MVVGQSNTHAGIGLNPELDGSVDGISQLGRFGNDDMQIIRAEEPLQHHTKDDNKIGFGLTFAKLLKEYLDYPNQIIIIPCGFGGTGFQGNQNTATGSSSLYSNTTGKQNTAYGYQSLYSNTTGNYNSANGFNSLQNNTTGNYNNAAGSNSLRLNTTGSENNSFGDYSLYSNTTGNQNTAVGSESLYFNTTGRNNNATGNKALRYNTTGDYNVATGSSSLYSNTTGTKNVAIGNISLYSNTTGSYNTAFGYNAQASAVDSSNQTVIGYNATGQADDSVVLGNADVTAVYMAQDSGAVVYAAGLNIGGTEITATADEINLLDDLTATTQELNYLIGATSSIQTQLDSKQAVISGAATTIVSDDLTQSRVLTSNESGKVSASSVSTTELGYLSGATSSIQTQLDSRQAAISGAATTIVSDDLTQSRVLTSCSV